MNKFEVTSSTPEQLLRQLLEKINSLENRVSHLEMADAPERSINEISVEMMERDLNDEMDEVELASHFQEPIPKKKDINDVKTMTLEEIKQWEAEQNNSNDIYKVKARVANLARSGGGALTQQGEMLCNTFVHTLIALYEFAETIEDSETRIGLTTLIRKQEGMPGQLINAAHAGVNVKRK